jgi:ferrous iron transport protein B
VNSQAATLDPMRLALVGVPNCGKTALFNRLTGSRQRVANYAGVTVERKEGSFTGPVQGARLAGRLQPDTDDARRSDHA